MASEDPMTLIDSVSEQSRSDERDFGRLFVQYQPRIYGYIRSLVAQRTDAEDVLQETASVLWQKFDSFRPGTDFLAWALNVAHYRMLYFRQQQKRNVLHFSEAFCEAVAADTVAEAGRLADLQGLLDDCMAKLSPGDYELFALRYGSETTTKHLAEQLGRPASTIYNAIHRIRLALAQCVERGLNREARP